MTRRDAGIVPVDLLCMGEAMVEYNHAATTEVIVGHGGDTSNCAIAAARQGARAGYLSAVGNDAHGRSLLELWREEGVDASRVVELGAYPTGYYEVRHGSDGHSFHYHRAGSAASVLPASQLEPQMFSDVRILHASGISQAISATARECVFAAMDAARAAGAMLSYDTNLRTQLWPLEEARETIHAALARCDVALPGFDDARALTGLDDPAEIVDHYLGLGPSIVALTLGAQGCLLGLRDGRGRRHVQVPAPAVEAVDATAAGDTFDGAFLAMLLEGTAPEEAARHACVAAALSTQGFGAVAPMPTRARVRARIAELDAGLSD